MQRLLDERTAVLAWHDAMRGLCHFGDIGEYAMLRGARTVKSGGRKPRGLSAFSKGFDGLFDKMTELDARRRGVGLLAKEHARAARGYKTVLARAVALVEKHAVLFKDEERAGFRLAANGSLHALNQLAGEMKEQYLQVVRLDPLAFVEDAVGSKRTYKDAGGRRVSVLVCRGAKRLAFGDGETLRGVVDNLLSDASVHPQAIGRFNLHVSARKAGDNVVVRFVSLGAKPLNSGIIAKLGVESFSTRRGVALEGHGLGKIRARQELERMGGGLSFYNYRGRLGSGPAMAIRLPAAV